MSEEMKPALTAAEWEDREFSSHYGSSPTTLSVDHKGRIFTDSVQADTHDRVILNEAADAPEVIRKVVTLCMAHAAECRETFGDDLDEGRRYAWVPTRQDVGRLRQIAGRQHQSARYEAHLAAMAGPVGGGSPYALANFQQQDPGLLSRGDREWLRSLAAKIEALLPPPA